MCVGERENVCGGEGGGEKSDICVILLKLLLGGRRRMRRRLEGEEKDGYAYSVEVRLDL